MAIMEEIFKKIKEHNIRFIDLRFTDTLGGWHHITYEVSNVNQGIFEHGMVFNGSSITGWRYINEADLVLRPDPTTFFIDTFASHPTAVLFCNVICPNTMQDYNRDPRSIAVRAEKYLMDTQIGSHVYIGSELEFSLFDDVKFHNKDSSSGYAVDAEEHCSNSERAYSSGNIGHRPKARHGYSPVAPIDSSANIRSEMMETLKDMGLWVKQHHHEMGASQNEMSFNFNTLLNTADNIQKYKYAVHNVAHSYGKTATFMPKPIYGDHGNSMHIHQSIFKAGKNIFYGTYYAGLSKEALYYIGGILKHAKALNAFTNASTNSYKRLAARGMVPTTLSYSGTNRSVVARVPFATTSKDKRIELSFPDPSANPYLALSAILMAGLDGIINKINPGDPEERDLFALQSNDLIQKNQVARSLEEALTALDRDREFLLQGRVFTNDQINSYIKLKMAEVEELNARPHPIEYKNYYSC